MAMKVKNTWKPYITAQEHKRLKKEVKSTAKKVI